MLAPIGDGVVNVDWTERRAPVAVGGSPPDAPKAARTSPFAAAALKRGELHGVATGARDWAVVTGRHATRAAHACGSCRARTRTRRPFARGSATPAASARRGGREAAGALRAEGRNARGAHPQGRATVRARSGAGARLRAADGDLAGRDRAGLASSAANAASAGTVGRRGVRGAGRTLDQRADVDRAEDTVDDAARAPGQPRGRVRGGVGQVERAPIPRLRSSST